MNHLINPYRAITSKIMKLFNMKENTKKILIFYRAITLNISFQIKVGTNLEKNVKFKIEWSPFLKKNKNYIQIYACRSFNYSFCVSTNEVSRLVTI